MTSKEQILEEEGEQQSAKKAGFAGKAVQKIKAFFSLPFFRVRLVQIYLLSFLATYIIEGLSHFRSLPQISHVIDRPLVFLTNVFIVSLLFAPAILFRKRSFFYALSFLIWLIVGVVDFILLHNRVTPFTANDFKMIGDAWNVVIHYYTVIQIIGLFLLIIFAVAGLVFAGIKFPKTKEPVHFKSAIPMCIGVIAVGLGLSIGSVKVGIMERTFPNLADAYQEYGLPYCFACSIVDTGISKPSGYSKNKVETVIDSLPSATPSIDPQLNEKPNVIFIQLESFFDPKRLNGISFASDPIPNFTYLYRNFSSGLLTVPSISAGTANTEFEVLTGMNMYDFGTGEYPYRTILQHSTSESMAYNLKNFGYATHAMHNNTATFYGRNVVFSNLGFNDFDSIETMPNIEMNALDWAKDMVLYHEIITALNSTEEQDYIFAVSVQGHGKYPDEEILTNSIELANVDDAYSDSTIYGLKYYTTQLNEMDAFIGRLVEYLSNRREKTVLVLYGDHLPGFNFEQEDLNRGNLLQTEYIMWTNFPMEAEHRDLHSYQLSSYVQERLGYHEGLITRLHQSYLRGELEDEEGYLNELQVLSYDMLYGEKYCWSGVNPYEKTNLKFGFYDMTPHALHPVYDKNNEEYYLTVYGSDFTPYCYVYINGEREKDTIFVSPTELFLPRITLKDGDLITVGAYNDGNTYSISAPFVYHESDYQTK